MLNAIALLSATGIHALYSYFKYKKVKDLALFT
jgi:hypothetical protein